MKCLSIWNPWASLIVGGEKRVETRGWKMHHRGPLLIHAGKHWTADVAMFATGLRFRTALARCGFDVAADEAKARAGWGMPFGAVIGRVEVVGCYSTDVCDRNTGSINVYESRGFLVLTAAEEEFGDYSACRFGFVLANPVRFPRPIPLAGKQGLFDVSDDLVARWTQPTAASEEARAG